jgi:4'-phosphopantetheinyl transferase
MDIRLYISGKVQSSKLFLKEVLKKEGIKNYVVKLNKYGKPYIKDINFNLSHNNQYIVCVVSKEPIGIDIEIVTDKLQRIRDSLLNKEELKKYKTDKQLTKV